MLALKVVVLLQILCVQAQLPLLRKLPGFRMNDCSLSAPIQLETFVDPLCGESRYIHHVLTNLSASYKPNEVCLHITLFPLIRHVHTLEVTTAVYQVVNALGESVFVKWLEAIYDVQEVLVIQNAPNLLRSEVREYVSALAEKTFPQLAKKNEHWSAEKARLDALAQVILEWKYAASRGVFNTNLFILNGVLLEAEKSTWEAEQWYSLINELLHPART